MALVSCAARKRHFLNHAHIRRTAVPNGISFFGKGSGMARGRTWGRRLLVAAGSALILLGALAAALHFWIGPAVIKSQVSGALGKYWAGRVEVGSATFRLFSAPSAGDISLYDAQGRLWLRATGVQPELRGWPGLHPAVTGVRVQGVEVVAHVVGGRIEPPLHAASKEQSAGPSLGAILVGDAAVTIISHDDGSRYGWKDLALSVTRAGGAGDANEAYDLALTQARPGANALTPLRGRVLPGTGRVHLEVKAKTDLKPGDSALIASALAPRGLPQVSGAVDIDLTIDGLAGRPDSFQVSGTADVRKLHVATAEGVVVEEATAGMELHGRGGVITGSVRLPIGTLYLHDAPVALDANSLRLTATLKTTSAELTADANAGGFWTGALGGTTALGRALVDGRASLGLGAPWQFTCDLRVKADLKELTIAGNAKHTLRDLRVAGRLQRGRISIVGLDALYAQGRLTGDAELWLVKQQGRRGRWSDWNVADRVQGLLKATLDNVDAQVVPIVPDLMAQFGQAVLQPFRTGTQGFSHGATVLSLAGGVLTFKSGRLANPLTALEFEAGGTINLRTKELDFHVVGVALVGLRDVLVKIPLINLMVNFKDKMVRVLVKGTWDQPAESLIRKEPLGDLAAGTTDFFKGVADTGKLGPAILKGVTDLFTPPDKPPGAAEE